MKGSVPFTAAVIAAIALVGSAAGAAGNSGGPLARSAVTSLHRISLSAANGGAKPRGLDGVPGKGSYAFLLRLKAVATGRAYEANLSRGRSAARTAAKNQLATVRAAQRNVIAALPNGTHVLYQTHAVLAGVVVYTKVANLPALQRISGVSAVYPIAPKKPSNSYAVHLENAPEVWATATAGSLGENSTIAIIDTGIDYTHADFGGVGTVQEYQDSKAQLGEPVSPNEFPGSKVIGGFDIVGDDYDADPTDPAFNPTPSPDPWPLDCDGHGSHVAGIAAGYGEYPDGSTFTGDYTTLGGMNSSDYQALFRIGPGMAPEATLYAYRVFGCAGSTDVVGDAIDMATDPNGDGDTSDHVDVINMSLGSDYASPQDGDSMLSNAASALGVSVVAAAGNAGDLFDVAGSPGNAARVIGAAASVDAYSQIDSLHVSAPVGIAGDYGAERSIAYDWANDPDISGNVVALSDASNKDGCDPLSAGDATAVAGKIAFLEWTDDDTVRRCGSAARSANVADAGAIGAILADDEETFAAGITGSEVIPVVMVTKSAGDTIRGALGSGVTISGTTANSFDQLIPANDDKVAGFSSRGIREAGDLKPDVTGVGGSVFSAGSGTGDEGISESGTSMATPMVAGLSALVRSEHSGWNAEEVKADIMNTAEQDVFTGDNHSGTAYAPNRVGAGRIDAKAALDNNVLAYVTDDPGAVSASFGPLAVTAATTLHKTIKVANKGATSETYDTSYDALTSIPGANYSVSPSQVTVAAGASTTVTLTLAIDPTQLTKTIDPTVDRNQADLPREYVADASGRVLFTPHDLALPVLRVPVYSAPRPASVMTQPTSIHLPSGAVETAPLALSGQGVDQGTGLESIQSAVAGFELQATSATLPNCSSTVTSGCIHASDELAADLRYVGTTSNAPELVSVGDNPPLDGLEYFVISTQGPWHTAASQNEYDIYIDSTGDGIPDVATFNTRLTDLDIFVSVTIDLNTFETLDIEPINDRFGDTDTALFDSDTLVMPVAFNALPGVSVGHSRIKYGIVTFGSFSSSPVDSAGFTSNLSGLDGSLSTDVFAPGVAVFGNFTGTGSPLLYEDMPGTTLNLRTDATSYAADHGQGALIVHFHNAAGNKAQVVELDHSLSVQRKGSGKGTVSSAPAGIDCGATCSHLFAAATSETLTAHHAAGSKFTGWSGGGCSGTGTCIVKLNDETSVTATFRDTARPRVTGLKAKVNHHKRTAKVTFRGTDPGNGSKGLRFKCKLDHGHFKSCRSPKLYKHLRHGKHTVQVKAIDKAGNVSKPVKRKFRV